jgi:hypothetical protein
MSRTAAVARAARHYDDGSFLADLARRVAIPTTSQEPENFPHLRRYLVAGGSQHAPDEHVLAPIRRDGLQIMAGLFRDVGKAPGPSR